MGAEPGQGRPRGPSRFRGQVRPPTTPGTTFALLLACAHAVLRLPGLDLRGLTRPGPRRLFGLKHLDFERSDSDTCGSGDGGDAKDKDKSVRKDKAAAVRWAAEDESYTESDGEAAPRPVRVAPDKGATGSMDWASHRSSAEAERVLAGVAPDFSLQDPQV